MRSFAYWRIWFMFKCGDGLGRSAVDREKKIAK